MVKTLSSKPASKAVLKTSTHHTTIGTFEARWSSLGLVCLLWREPTDLPEIAEKKQNSGTLEGAAEQLQNAFQDYLTGNFYSLDSVAIDGSDWTPFFSEVYRICRTIPPGETLSYAELAAKAGSPGASRAVGQAMRTNRIPLLIPCHRVVGASGKLHGYSGPGGLETKRLLLDHERGYPTLNLLSFACDHQ